ncbi:MAG: LpxI family protein [Desulfonatronovibrio sp. MSAO_Bac4]|nr:MAG: LpxI family protein [Desulfonatronovibrio sp. MSAO_Bac4]
MSGNRTLGLVAGGGQFPFLVAREARKLGYDIVAVAFNKDTDTEIDQHVSKIEWIKLGQLGRLIKFFKANNVDQVVFAGPINKPGAFDIRPDIRAIRLLFSLKSRNDNSLLTAVAGELNSEGLEVVSAIKFVPGLVSPVGNISKRRPSEAEKNDILFGWPLLKNIGAMDIGQCLVVKERVVVAVEAIEGTDQTILRAGSLIKKDFTVLKTFKPGQDERIDLPAMGLKTIETMIQAGASCLAYEAGKSLFFDLDEAIELAQKNKISIIGIDPEKPLEDQI